MTAEQVTSLSDVDLSFLLEVIEEAGPRYTADDRYTLLVLEVKRRAGVSA